MHTQLKNFAYCLIIHFLSQSAYAAEKDDKPFAEQHVILQVSDADPAKYSAALDIANNLIKHYQGPDIIAFGAGVQMYYAENNPNHSRFNSLMDNGVKF